MDGCEDIELPRSPNVDVGLAELAPAFDLVLCDVWGVVHNGVRQDTGAVDALQRFRRGGGTVILVTNAPVPADHVARRLASLDVPRDAYDDIATSGDVTIGLIEEAGRPPVFGIGPQDETVLFDPARYSGEAPRLVSAEEAALAVCVGLDEARPTPEDYDEGLAVLKRRGLTLICANPDVVVEVGDDLVYCAGAIATRYAAMGGTVVQAGKPFPLIYERALQMAARVASPVPATRTLAIGDAIATDMRGAEGQGYASLFITGGIHREALQPGGRGAPIEAAALADLLSREGVVPYATAASLRW